MQTIEEGNKANKSCCESTSDCCGSSAKKPVPRIKVVKKPSSSCCESTSDCCGSSIQPPCSCDEPWITGKINTPAGSIPQAATKLTAADKIGTIKARLGINRMDYKINPGLYCTGLPDSNSPVLVTCNYKMSFDVLRSELSGLSAWIVVLDTKGINVWCAAGKGTFGTDELINRISKTNLSTIVSHRTVILPQLGAAGVSAHIVRKNTGFRVVYGPVRAQDVKSFINSGMKATAEMKKVNFTFTDRLVLTPIELIGAVKPSLLIFGVLFILNLIGIGPFGLIDLYSYLGAIFIGCVLTPILLPWIPFRAFSMKGALLGLLWAIAINLINGWPDFPAYSWLRALAYIFILPAISAYGAMNFTGCSTYTSFSGVIKEMRTALPVIIISICAGALLIIINSFISL